MTENIYWGVARKGQVLRVAVPDIYDEFALERIRVETGCRLEPEQHTELEIRQMIRQLQHNNAVTQGFSPPLECHF